MEITIQDLYKFVNKLDKLSSSLSEGTLEEIRKELLDNVIIYKAKEFKEKLVEHSRTSEASLLFHMVGRKRKIYGPYFLISYYYYVVF